MITKPLISIITPVYNLESYIEQTIHSVLGQTYQNWEWIIMDDGSTDNTRNIINSYKDERIKYFFQIHGGIDNICLTHNKALSLTKGDFIALIDGDDLWPEYKLEKQLNSFIDDKVVLSYGECCLIDSEGKKIDYARNHPDRSIAMNDPPGSALKELLFKSNFIYNPTVMVRKSVLQKIGGFTIYKGLAHDFPTWCQLSLEGKFNPLPQCLGCWRKHNNSVSFYNAEYRFKNMIKFMKEFTELHKQKIESLGFDLNKDNINYHIEKRLQLFIKYFPYDRAMQMLAIGMFKEAKKEISKYLNQGPSLKNRFIIYLIYISAFLSYDVANPVRKLKGNSENIIKKYKFLNR